MPRADIYIKGAVFIVVLLTTLMFLNYVFSLSFAEALGFFNSSVFSFEISWTIPLVLVGRFLITSGSDSEDSLDSDSFLFPNNLDSFFYFAPCRVLRTDLLTLSSLLWRVRLAVANLGLIISSLLEPLKLCSFLLVVLLFLPFSIILGFSCLIGLSFETIETVLLSSFFKGGA